MFPSCPHLARVACATWLALLALAARAQMPSQAEFESAVDTARPTAAANGLSLHTADLWALMLKARAPLLARVAGRRCHVGYSAYTPGRDFTWLFPALGEQDRRVWLQALVHHELAHCLAATSAAELAQPERQIPVRQREAHADLAFALYADAHGDAAGRLVAMLADLRARMAPGDPDHDTAAVLRCYLAHPMRVAERVTGAAEWSSRLATWQQRCGYEPASTYAAR